MKKQQLNDHDVKPIKQIDPKNDQHHTVSGTTAQLKHASAGGLSGAITGAICQPFDVVKKNYWKPTGSITSGSSSAKEEDIYIDDEQIEGSGGRGEIHDDLEKDAEYSGSGYGPDDEDSTSRKTYSSSSNINLNKNNNDRSKVQEQDLGGIGSGDDKLDSDDEDYDNEDDSDIGFNKNDLDDPTSDDDHDEYHDEDKLFLPTIQPSTEVISVVGNLTTTEKTIHPVTHTKDTVPLGGVRDAYDDAEEPEYDDGSSGRIIPDRPNPASTNNKDSKEVSRSNTDSDSGSLDLDIDESGNPIIPPGTIDKTSDSDSTKNYNEVFIMNKGDDRPTSFFAQPGILAAVIGGAVVGLLCAILVVMFIVYRMRKKDEGSYALDEPKRSPAANSYAKNANNREFYA